MKTTIQEFREFRDAIRLFRDAVVDAFRERETVKRLFMFWLWIVLVMVILFQFGCGPTFINLDHDAGNIEDWIKWDLTVDATVFVGGAR